jgi:hypothetical protein
LAVLVNLVLRVAIVGGWLLAAREEHMVRRNPHVLTKIIKEPSRIN